MKLLERSPVKTIRTHAHTHSPTFSHQHSHIRPHALSNEHELSRSHAVTPTHAPTLSRPRPRAPSRARQALGACRAMRLSLQASKSSARESQLTLLSPAGLHPPPPPSPHALSPSRPPFHSPTHQPASLLALTRSCDCYARALPSLAHALPRAHARPRAHSHSHPFTSSWLPVTRTA